MARLQDLLQGNDLWKDFRIVRKAAAGSEDTVFDVKIRVLTVIELDRARVNATTYVKAIDKAETLGGSRGELVEDARVVEVLSMAIMDPESTPKEPRPWASPELIRVRLRHDEVSLLWKAYEDFQADQGQVRRHFSDDEYNAAVEQMAKEASADFLALCDSPTRKAFEISMASELVLLRMLVSSLTSESTEPTDGSASALSTNGSSEAGESPPTTTS